jgi:FMN-binding protein
MHIINLKQINSLMLLSLVFFLITRSMTVFAETQHLTEEQFLKQYFSTEVPKPTTLWLVKERAKNAKEILGHQPEELRPHFWKLGNKTAWILNEIGKTEPITAGFVVEDGKITHVRVLTYRESRGGEVHHPAFVKQYFGAMLQKDLFLDRNIDGISGATLSVRSMSRMARLALYYDALSKEE